MQCGWHVQLEQVKANLRDVIRSQKMNVDTKMMVARASAALDAAKQPQMQGAHREMMTRKRYTDSFWHELYMHVVLEESPYH